MRWFVFCALLLSATVAYGDESKLEPGEVFARRVLPIVQSSKSSSCSECHFGGVDLKNYVKEDQATTFAALREAGLIDIERPENSRLLQFIRKHGDDTDPLVARVRESELAAFSLWIKSAVRDPELLAAKPNGAVAGGPLPDEVIRHMRKDRVLRSFYENVWSEIGRCTHCHSPESNQKLVEKHGERMSWIHPRDPAATLSQCVEQGIIDLAEPEKSELVLKPLNLVEHGGGPKFAIGSRTDKNFRRFLVDYGSVVAGRYTSIESLPDEQPTVAIPSGQFLRINELPESYARKLLRVELYRETDGGWSKEIWGVAENPVNGRQRAWMSPIFSAANRQSKRGKELLSHETSPLPEGRYQVKIYVDRRDQAKENRDYEMTQQDFIGAVVVHGQWKPGFREPKIIKAPKVAKD